MGSLGWGIVFPMWFGRRERWSFFTLPWRAGESHMDFYSILRGLTIWILKMSPDDWEVSDEGFQESFPAVAGPACGQRAARSARSCVHCAGRNAVWCGKLRGDGRVRPEQGRVFAAAAAA